MTNQASGGSEELRLKFKRIVSPVNRNENSSLGSSTPNEAVDKLVVLFEAEKASAIQQFADALVEKKEHFWQAHNDAQVGVEAVPVSTIKAAAKAVQEGA